MLPPGAQAISFVVRQVPDFAPVIERLDAEEEGELGSFQAMNELGRWWRARGSDKGQLGHLLEVADELYTKVDAPLAADLAIEFFEWVCADVGAANAPLAALSPHAAEWFRRYGWTP